MAVGVWRGLGAVGIVWSAGELTNGPFFYTLGGMCRATVCSKCKKPTWAGCGAHIEQVLGDVPKAQRCHCREDKLAARASGANPGGAEASGWLAKLRGR